MNKKPFNICKQNKKEIVIMKNFKTYQHPKHGKVYTTIGTYRNNNKFPICACWRSRKDMLSQECDFLTLEISTVNCVSKKQLEIAEYNQNVMFDIGHQTKIGTHCI